MDLNVKLYGILVNDKEEILVKKEDLSLPGDDIVVGIDLFASIKEIIKKKTNINLVDVILFDQDSKIEESHHVLGIFFIGTFYKEEIEKINQDYKWIKLRKVDLTKADAFTEFVIKQIINED